VHGAAGCSSAEPTASMQPRSRQERLTSSPLCVQSHANCLHPAQWGPPSTPFACFLCWTTLLTLLTLCCACLPARPARPARLPACLAQVPIAVQGRIVNWIDSKATFGDDKIHRSGGGRVVRVGRWGGQANQVGTHCGQLGSTGPLRFCVGSWHAHVAVCAGCPPGLVLSSARPALALLCLPCHRQQTAEQYERYVNRFGPGLVIYWHGYIADLNQVRGELKQSVDGAPGRGELRKGWQVGTASHQHRTWYRLQLRAEAEQVAA